VTSPLPPPTLAVVLAGAGRVGTAAAHLLGAAGHRIVGVWSRTPGSAARAARRLAAPARALEDSVPHADLVLVGATDAAIEGVAARLSSHVRPGAVVAHFAGALGAAPLADAVRAGARACALHPVQPCPDVDTAIRRLPGSAWGVTCEPELAPWARGVVERDLRGIAVAVAERDRPLWHAAAVTTANGINAVVAVGEAMLGAIGAPARTVLGPLSEGALANALERGGGASLTGPVVRGEGDAVRRHIGALAERAPDLVSAYVAASRTVLAGARVAGRVDGATAAEIEDALALP
jgi:predicted short-subunit dehydrogenase-like oxidoreductase (DUF2520 family)